MTNESHMHKLNQEKAFGMTAHADQNEDETKIKVKRKVFLQVLWLSLLYKNQHVCSGKHLQLVGNT